MQISRKALAQAKPSQSQALVGGFGLAWDFRKPKPPQARPKPGLPGQSRAGTSLHTGDGFRVLSNPGGGCLAFHLLFLVPTVVQFPFIDRYFYPDVCNVLEYTLSRISPLIPVPIVVE